MCKWTGWKDVDISKDLIGATITKGSGYYAKEYFHIKIPSGYGYDGYVFLLSKKIVGYSSDDDEGWFSICDDMNIELFYDPDLRETGKRYPRYKMTGYDLYENIFKKYEDFLYEERQTQRLAETAAKEKRERANIGTVVCGRYLGNIYGYLRSGNNYQSQDYLCSFFKSNAGVYSNHEFQKVQNVKVEFPVMKISKYHFLRYEAQINDFIREYELYKNMMEKLTGLLATRNKNPIGTEDITNKHLLLCESSVKEIKERLISFLKEVSKENKEVRE